MNQMTPLMDIQAEKQKLMNWLSNLENPGIIERLSFFKDQLTNNPDWWDQLADAEKQSILQGLRDIEEGKTMVHEDVMKKYGAKE